VPTIIRQANQHITSVRDALGIRTSTPVVLISGGADTFDPAIAPKLTQLIGEVCSARAGRPGPSSSMAAPTPELWR
jgi:hypothetical protein